MMYDVCIAEICQTCLDPITVSCVLDLLSVNMADKRLHDFSSTVAAALSSCMKEFEYSYRKVFRKAFYKETVIFFQELAV